jgi:DNA primase
MSTTWICFKELREKIPIGELLNRFGVELKVRGERATGLCPLPSHPVRNDGKKRSPSFSVHLGKGIWHCFGCGAKGNVLDLASIFLGFDPEDPAQLRKAALKLVEMFNIDCARPKAQPARAKPSIRVSHPVKEAIIIQPAPVVDAATPVRINEPIDFELKHLDPRHPYLADRGFTPATVAHFGLGFCSRGLMKDRIAIPIHDEQGRLVGYAGRLVDDAIIDADHPRYLLPGQRERDGVVNEFRKSLLVYNLHRIHSTVDDLIVVEGFASAWWLHQNGYTNVLAVMGSSCSLEQAGLIAGHLTDAGRIWLLPDGNGAGAQMASQALPLLASHRFCRLVKLPAEKQPTDCTANEFASLLGMP